MVGSTCVSGQNRAHSDFRWEANYWHSHLKRLQGLKAKKNMQFVLFAAKQQVRETENITKQKSFVQIKQVN